ncbi:MAG: ATP-dependent Clp protease adaptor ClpS [Bacteroidales bacterium]|jgi:ATP-dependent Clp protease adaptor protein ClpS|nr:ATP-dependent Clp protease adaptor ClpS [Bacteroidales bacterium]
MVKQKENPSLKNKDDISSLRELTLFNDDVNTFDFVIQCLVDICNHDQEQAEQCALIAHYKGKCNVKTGVFYDLKPLLEELKLRGLTVSIE